MFKKILYTILLAGLCTTTIVAQQAPPVDNLYRIAYKGDDVTVDGELTDWSDAQWVFMSIDRPAYQILNPTNSPGIYPSSPSDASGWFAMKMDDGYAYFAVNVRDENNPMIEAAVSPDLTILYDHLSVYLGLYDIGDSNYLNPHQELLNETNGYFLTDPVTDEDIYTGSTYRIAPEYDNTETTLGADYQIAVRALPYGSGDEAVTYNYGYADTTVANTAVATKLWSDEKGYSMEWKVPLSSLAGKIAKQSGAYTNFEWPLFTPENGKIISLDAEIGDADEVVNGEVDTEYLRLGTGSGLGQYSGRFGFRGEIVDMSLSPNNTPRWTYSIDYKDEQDVTIDADLSDWLDTPFMGLSQDIPNFVVIQGTPDSPDDFSGYLGMKMDSTNVYFAMRIRDAGTPLIEVLDTPNLAFNHDHLSAYLGLYDISDVPSNPHVEGPGEFEMYNYRHQGTDSARIDTIQPDRTYRIAPEYDNTETTRGPDFQISVRALPYGTDAVNPEEYNGAYVDTTIFKGNEAAAQLIEDESGYVLEWKVPFSSLAGEISAPVKRFMFKTMEWPLFKPEDGVTISFDADVTDEDEGDGRAPNRYLRLGDQPALWRDSKSWKMRGEITATAEKTFVSNEEENELTAELPSSIKLRQNYPNPFNPSTNIEFVLPQAMNVTLKVYNILGQEVAVLAQGMKRAGTHKVTFNAGNGISSGIYLYRLEVADQVITRKLTLIK